MYTFGILSVLLLFPLRVICSIKTPGNVVKNVGHDVVFMCNTTNGNSVLSSTWGLLGPDDKSIIPQFIYISTRTSGPVLSNDLDSTAVMYKGRVSWVGDLSAGHAWFKITNLTLQDTNTYVTAIREQGQSESLQYSMHLTVAVPPQFKPQPPKRKIIAEGQDLNLTCTAVGPPIPNITWVQVIGHVTKSTGLGSATLRIPNIRKDQNGTYECQARNNPNERPVIAQSVVTVYFKPAVDESQSTSKSKSWNGNSLRMRCFATGLPAPGISWYEPTNQQINTGVKNVPGGSEVTLRTTADQGDYGQYKCRATNTLGSDEHVINVTQLSRKQSPTQKRKPRSKKAAAEETYENDLELEDNTASTVTASRAQQPVQTGPVYETIQQSNPNKAGSSDNASYYQGLNLFPNTSIQETYGPPLYEPLDTRSVESSMQHNDNKQHSYKPLNTKTKTLPINLCRPIAESLPFKDTLDNIQVITFKY